MPWAMFNRPSIQLGVLKGFLSGRGAEVVCLHPYLEAAAGMGPETYRRIALDGWSGEALYAPLVMPERRDAAERLFKRQMGGDTGGEFSGLHRLLAARLEKFAAAVDWSGFDLIGFSVCFFQLTASLAAARMIRQRCTDVRIVFGGSQFSPEGAAALARAFPEVDHVVCGEGEAGLLRLCQTLVKGGSPPAVLADHGQLAPEELADPDYDDYFVQMSRFFPGAPFVPEVPLEFSRGCWWNRCRFCNLNLQWQGYRRLRAGRVFSLVERESARGVLDFFFTDNVLPRDEAGRFFDLAAESGRDFSFFAELRAEQRRELARFCRGGLREIQVGIEAFSGPLLEKMGKGASVLANLAVMKQALACGVRLSGNLICGFPGSTAEDVEETLAVIDLALPYDPLDPAWFFLGDGSPVAQSPAEYGITAVLPHRNNAVLFGRGLASSLRLPVLGYRGDANKQKKLWRPVRKRLKEWRRFHERRKSASTPALACRDGGSFLLIRQELEGGGVLVHRLKGMSREIYLAGADVCGVDEALARFPSLPADRLAAFLQEMEDKRLVCFRDGKFLSLAPRMTGQI